MAGSMAVGGQNVTRQHVDIYWDRMAHRTSNIILGLFAHGEFTLNLAIFIRTTNANHDDQVDMEVS